MASPNCFYNDWVDCIIFQSATAESALSLTDLFLHLPPQTTFTLNRDRPKLTSRTKASRHLYLFLSSRLRWKRKVCSEYFRSIHQTWMRWRVGFVSSLGRRSGSGVPNRIQACSNIQSLVWMQNDRRERVYKCARDVVNLAKKSIFSLQARSSCCPMRVSRTATFIVSRSIPLKASAYPH